MHINFRRKIKINMVLHTTRIDMYHSDTLIDFKFIF